LENNIAENKNLLKQFVADAVKTPPFDRLGVDVSLYLGINPTTNINDIGYYQVKAKKTSSGDVKITLGDRDGTTIATAYLPLGVGAILMFWPLNGENGFNQDILPHEEYDVKVSSGFSDIGYGIGYISGSSYNSNSLVTCALEIKCNTESLDEFALGEFYYRGFGNIYLNVAAIVAFLPTDEPNFVLPSVPEFESLSANAGQTLLTGHIADAMKDVAQTVKAQAEQYVQPVIDNIEDVQIDVAMNSTTLSQGTLNTNRIYYYPLFARIASNGEMQLQLQNREGEIIAEAVTPHRAAALLMSLVIQDNSFSNFELGANIDNGINYEIDVNSTSDTSNMQSSFIIYAVSLEITHDPTMPENNTWQQLGEIYMSKTDTNQGSSAQNLQIVFVTPY
jgi:hypothetical protein